MYSLLLNGYPELARASGSVGREEKRVPGGESRGPGPTCEGHTSTLEALREGTEAREDQAGWRAALPGLCPALGC